MRGGPAQQPMPAPRQVHQSQMLNAGINGVDAPVHAAPT